MFFFVALRWAPRPFGGARAKKKTPPRVFFFCSGPGERQGKEKPRWKPARGQSKKKNTTQGVFFLLRPRRKAREGEAPLEAGTGPEQKKKHQPGCFFFCSGPGERQGKEKPRWAPARGQSKKSFFFFALAPCRRPTGLLLPLPFPGAGAKKKTPWVVFFFFFALAPCRLPTGLLLPLTFAGAAAKKKTPWMVFFFALAPCRLPTGLLLPLPFAGAAAKKKKHPGWCFFFFCCGPARTLTHSLRAWVAMPPPRRGGVFFFAAAPPGPGWCFFFAVAPPGRSLTHGGLGRPGGFFFLLRPRRVFLDNSKKCLGYYIGSKRPGGATPSPAFPRGRSKKKTPWVVFFFLLWPRAGFQRGFSFPCLSPGPQQQKNTLGGVFFFAAAPRGRSLTHCGPGWRCLPLAGAVFFFFAAAPPGPGWCFFFCCGPARTLTHSRWAGAISARPGWCFFFCCRPPPGSF